MRILVTGSRDWTDRDVIYTALSAHRAHRQDSEMVLVHGGATGADSIAAHYAEAMDWGIEEHRAQWAVYGKRAGILRNTEMVDAGADICLAFIKDYSPGATHCATYAGSCGMEVRIYRA